MLKRAAAFTMVVALAVAYDSARADSSKIETRPIKIETNVSIVLGREEVETHDAYRINRKTTTEKWKKNPEQHWESERWITYQKWHEENEKEHTGFYRSVKYAHSIETHYLDNEKPASSLVTYLSWEQADGTRVEFFCNKFEGDLHHSDQHEIIRSDSSPLHRQLFKSMIRMSDGEKTYFAVEGPGALKKSDPFEDASKCDDAGFPFDLLKEKPPELK